YDSSPKKEVFMKDDELETKGVLEASESSMDVKKDETTGMEKISVEEPSEEDTIHKNYKASDNETEVNQQSSEKFPRNELPEELPKSAKGTALSNDIPLPNKAKKSTKKLVKLPVLLANVVFDIDISRSIQVDFPIEHVMQIDWSLASVLTRILLPSTTLLFEGFLVAEIKYVSKQTKTIHSCKVPITCDKVTHVDWSISPEMGNE